MQATEDGCDTTLSDTYTVNVECPCTLNSSIPSATSFTYVVNDSEQNDGLTLFTATGVSCGTVTHSASHSPATSGIFTATSTGYSWETNDYSLVG